MCVICFSVPPTLHTDPHKLFEAVWSCVIERHKPFPLHSQRLCGSHFRSPQRQLLESRLVGLPWPSLPDCMCAWRSSSPYVVCVCLSPCLCVCQVHPLCAVCWFLHAGCGGSFISLGSLSSFIQEAPLHFPDQPKCFYWLVGRHMRAWSVLLRNTAPYSQTHTHSYHSSENWVSKGKLTSAKTRH